MEADWDLHAVVRGCTTTTTTVTSISSSSSSFSVPSFASSGTYYQPPSNFFSVSPNEKPSNSRLSLSNTFESKNTFEAARSNCIEELHELCEPFFLKSQPPSLQLQTPSSPISSFSYSSSPKSAPTQQKQHQPNKQPSHASSANTPRSKRRKNQLKKVCQVAAENLSSDIWAWRKYGQKPIKGSPYPRGYYRCSSSKGCLARKQVERNRTDPTMFIVTYTGEHSHPAPTHRNSLAGSTRQKPQTPPASTTAEYSADKSLITKEPFSPVATTSVVVELEEAAALAPPQISSTEEDMEDLMNDDDDDVELENIDQLLGGSSDMVLTDDFFEGLDELTGSSVAAAAAATEDCFSDPFVSLPSWVSNNNAATAAGGSS